MNKVFGVLRPLLIPAFVAAAVLATPAIAQDKANGMKAAPAAKAEKGKSTLKMLLENDKVRVYEVTYKPGDVNTGVVSTATRVVRPLKGGTLELAYADGKKETVVRKVGEPYVLVPGPAYTSKNIGKTVVQLYVVQLK